MLSRIGLSIRRWRRRLSRSEWITRLLRLSTSPQSPHAPGLILIQIDGLAHPELLKALARGRMPFLKRLIRKEHYRLEHMYPGVPSTTPAVQAELFYGVRQAVPSFGFLVHETQKLGRMYDPEVAALVEKRINTQDRDPLLTGGSCYLSLFKAGTKTGEAHFCPADQGWGPALRKASPLAIAILIVTNLWSLVRTSALIILELLLSIADCIRGIIAGQNPLKELLFIPTRVAVTILTRELCTMGVKVDITRGLPIIYINLLGYDEQSHRRGPKSAFAHWVLKGIDSAIAKIWKAAHTSERRHYDVWIFSDHGQEQTQAYEELNGRSLGDALSEALSSLPSAPQIRPTAPAKKVRFERARLFGSEWMDKSNIEQASKQEGDKAPTALVALGPIAMLYNIDLGGANRADVARMIVEQAKVPLVLYLQDPKSPASSPVHGWWREGPIALPKDGRKLMGNEHPYPDQAAEDMANLCRHPDSGDFMMYGWCTGLPQPITFAMENGSHGGSGPNETHAFTLMPEDIQPPDPSLGYWRPQDLRTAARSYLRGAPPKRMDTHRAPQKVLRIMTYNVHSCRGLDGKLSPQRIARVIARYHPDIVALQELDVMRKRSGGLDQAERLARLLTMDLHFQPTINIKEERYGDAILTHLPARLIKKGILPGPPAGKGRLFNPAADEPRGAVWIEIEANGRPVQIINTHLGLSRTERLRQVDALLGPEWLSNPRCTGERVLLGDFNALPNSAECKRLGGYLRDAQEQAPHHTPKGTFLKVRIDHIFLSAGLKVKKVLVPKTSLTRQASDHLPLIVDIEIPPRVDK
ncbi:endonuclease/exonuclease/phosphatase family protein [Microbulbifer sp. ZKSA006]|uniref:endonuclease/exonuclease/phosphatase family protein n=1 Tax=Microbulbifer sp. ZKSA006 TaxID=3243390 RepID=UPI0040392763